MTKALERLANLTSSNYRSLDDLFNTDPIWKWETVTKQDPCFMLTENENAYILTLDLPGFKRNEVNIEANSYGVTLVAKRNRDGVVKEFKTETDLADFGEVVDFQNVKAKLEDGVLTVTLPKLPEPENLKIRKINVE